MVLAVWPRSRISPYDSHRWDCPNVCRSRVSDPIVARRLHPKPPKMFMNCQQTILAVRPHLALISRVTRITPEIIDRMTIFSIRC